MRTGLILFCFLWKIILFERRRCWCCRCRSCKESGITSRNVENIILAVYSLQIVVRMQYTRTSTYHLRARRFNIVLGWGAKILFCMHFFQKYYGVVLELNWDWTSSLVSDLLVASTPDWSGSGLVWLWTGVALDWSGSGLVWLWTGLVWSGSELVYMLHCCSEHFAKMQCEDSGVWTKHYKICNGCLPHHRNQLISCLKSVRLRWHFASPIRVFS